MQGHVVHVVGVGEGWGRELPGSVVGKGEGGMEGEERDGGKMKIAWRYERLGEVGGARGGSALAFVFLYISRIICDGIFQSECHLYVKLTVPVPPTPNRGPKAADTRNVEPTPTTPFCHTFDLTKRLTRPPGTSINYIPISPTSNPYESIIPTLTHSLTTTPPHTIHRLIIPALLSPALYPPSSSIPTSLLPFFHSLRSLLRTHSTRLTALLTLPLSLHPRTMGLVRWIEHLSDGVLELIPFPHSTEVDVAPGKKGGGGGGEVSEKPQGMAKVHKLPVVTEKGGGGGGGDELAFELSRRRFVIGKFSLPPVEGGEEARRGEGEGGKGMGKGDVEF